MAEHCILIIIYYNNDNGVLNSIAVVFLLRSLVFSFRPLLHCILITEEKGKFRNEVGKKLKAFFIYKNNKEMKSRPLEK